MRQGAPGHPKAGGKTEICTLASQCEFYTNLAGGSGGERGKQTLPPNP